MLPLSHFAQFSSGDLLGEQSALEPLSRGHVLEHTLGKWSQITCSANMDDTVQISNPWWQDDLERCVSPLDTTLRFPDGQEAAFPASRRKSKGGNGYLPPHICPHLQASLILPGNTHDCANKCLSFSSVSKFQWEVIAWVKVINWVFNILQSGSWFWLVPITIKTEMFFISWWFSSIV